MNYKVAKFGGSSLSTREQFERVLDIVMQDQSKRFIVLSAPGKRRGDDSKVTDLLINAANGNTSSRDTIIERLKEIYSKDDGLIEELSIDLDSRLSKRDLINYQDRVKAFGEYASARLMTSIAKGKGIDARFLDPKDIGLRVINGNRIPQPDPSCYSTIGEILVNGENIPLTFIPGFYGYSSEGQLLTLPRGGSDTTGAVIANAVNAAVYENWTDEDGLRRADPRIITNPELITEITYIEARELASKGFKLEQDSLIPLIEKHIPMNVRNTNNTRARGTLVVHDRIVSEHEYISGVTCKRGYVSINLDKVAMNQERGFGRKVLQVLEEEGINFEHTPTGNDNMSIIVEQSELIGVGKLDRIFRRLKDAAGKLELSLGEGLSLVAVAGLGMKRYGEVPARVLYSLKNIGIYPRTMNMGASDISFFIGVREDLGEEAVRTIYGEFF